MTIKTYLSLCFELPAGKLPEKLKLLPYGAMTGNDGRQFTNDNPTAVLEHFKNKKRQIPLDIEHATEIKGPKGEPAPAQGWFRELEIIDGEIWAPVALNSDGERLIENENYKYISPAFLHNKDGQIIGISSVGLTNKPNLDLPSLNHEEEPSTMKISAALASLLALNAETATEQDVINAVTQLQDDTKLALNRAENPDLKLFVPMETHQLALNREKEANDKLSEIRENEFETLVDGAISDGKVAPANKEMFLSMCRQDGGVDSFKTYLETAPQIASSETKHNKQPGNDATKLDEAELAMCHQMGLTEDEYLAAK